MTNNERTALVREILHETFPNAFAAKGEEKRPLAIGIEGQIHLRCPELSKWHLAAAIADYTRGPTYLRNVVEGAQRVDLEGEPNGLVTASEAAYAAMRKSGISHYENGEKAKARRAKRTAGESGELRQSA